MYRTSELSRDARIVSQTQYRIDSMQKMRRCTRRPPPDTDYSNFPFCLHLSHTGFGFAFPKIRANRARSRAIRNRARHASRMLRIQQSTAHGSPAVRG